MTPLKRLENLIRTHTTDMDNPEYIDTMRGLAEWAMSQAEIAEYQEEIKTHEYNNY